jgi:hypothetical protein
VRPPAAFVLAGCEPVKYSVEEAGRATVTISSGDTVPARLVNEIPPPIEASAKVRQSPKALTVRRNERSFFAFSVQ